MQKIIVMIGCWCLAVVALSQPNIARVEYFLNADPGFGNATAVSITAAPNLVDQSVPVNISALPMGLNTLYIRSRDANGKWSITNRLIFVRTALGSAIPNINKAEYFIDTEPGFGNGINIPIATPGTDLPNLVFNADLNSVADGLHQLYIRTRTVNGLWSITNRTIFVKASTGAVSPNITRAEYFFDADPGFGNANSIPITPAQNISNLIAPINIAALAEGIHQFFLRTADANGRWSITGRYIILRSSPSILPANIVRAETFIDTDPGFGNGVPIALNASTNLPDFVFPLNITGLSAGTHRMYLRSQNALGKWSVTALESFNVVAAGTAPYIAINSITGKNLCGDKQFDLSFHTTGVYNAGNIFNVQLSDAAGNFGAPTVIGSMAATTSALVKCTLPLHIPNGSNYRVRVVSTNPVLVGATADTVFVLNDQPRYPDSTLFIVCANETVNLNPVYSTAPYSVSWNVGNPAAAPAGVHRMITTNAAGTLQCKDTAWVTVKQDVATWLGTTNNSWHTAANWSTGRVPDAKTHVIVQAGAPNVCTITTQNGQAASVQLLNGAQVVMAAGRQMQVTANCNPLPTN